MYTIKLSQENKKGETTFEASAKLNLQNDKLFEQFAKSVSEFCKKTIKFAKRSKERGVNISANIRKSQPINIELTEEGENVCTLKFKNFGKFVEKSPQNVLEAQLRDSAEFTSYFVNWEYK